MEVSIDKTGFAICIKEVGREIFYDIKKEVTEGMNESSLEKAMIEQPEKFCYCGALKVWIQEEYNKFKEMKFPLWEAGLYRDVRERLQAQGTKVTEGAIDAFVKTEYREDYEKRYETLYNLERAKQLLEVGMEAFRMRVNMLQSISAMRRVEMSGLEMRDMEGKLARKIVRSQY